MDSPLAVAHAPPLATPNGEKTQRLSQSPKSKKGKQRPDPNKGRGGIELSVMTKSHRDLQRGTISFENPSVFDEAVRHLRRFGDSSEYLISRKFKHFAIKLLIVTLLGAFCTCIRILLHRFVHDKTTSNDNDECYLNSQLYTWYLLSCSFGTLCTISCVATLASWVPNETGRKYAYATLVFLGIFFAYMTTMRYALDEMPPCAPYSSNYTDAIAVPYTGECQRRTDVAWNATSVCPTVPEFMSDIELERYSIDPAAVIPSLDFTKKVLRDVVVTQITDDAPAQARCLNVIMQSTCYFIVYAGCSADCTRQHACESFCDEVEAACPGLYKFVRSHFNFLSSISLLYDANIYEALFDFIDGFAHGCSIDYVSNTSNCVHLDDVIVGGKDNASAEETGNCSSAEWEKIDKRERDLEKQEELARASHERDIRQIQDTWLRKATILDFVFICILWVGVLVVALFLERDQVSQAVRRSCRDFAATFRQVHSPSTLFAAVFLLTLVIGLYAMALTFAYSLENRQPYIILALFAAGQIPLFQVSTKLFSLHMFKDNALQYIRSEARESTLRRRGGVGPLNSSRKLPSTPKLVAQTSVHALVKGRAYYRRNFSMSQGKYFIEAMAARELVELIVQVSGFLIASSCQDRTLVLAYITVLCISTVVTSLFLVTRKRFLVAYVDCFFDLLFITLNFVAVIQAKQKFIPFKQAVSLFFPVASVCYISNQILLTFMLRNYEQYRASASASARRLRGKSRTLTARPIRGRKSKILVACLSVLASFAVGIVYGRVWAQERRCRERFGECVWDRVFPRVYFRSGFFRAASCDGVCDVATLDINGCNLGSLDFPLEKFTSLKNLSMQENAVEVLPGGIAKLVHSHNLTKVDFDGASVRVLDWRDQGLSSLSLPTFESMFRDMQSVVRIDLSGNNITEEVNSVLGNFPRLSSLDLSKNRLRSIPLAILADLPRLVQLNLRDNRIENLTGMFADWALDSDYGREVLFGRNPVREIKWVYLNGALPSEVGLLTDLERIFLDSNVQLVGTLPSQLGALSSLKILSFENNHRVRGTIPTQLGRLRKLETLRLEGMTHISGTIPSEIYALPELVELRINSLRNITGRIDASIGLLNGSLARLEVRAMSALTGEMPSQLGALTQLEHLRLSSLPLMSGSIPSEVGMLTNLRSFTISGMPNLVSTIPAEVISLRNLRFINVSHLPSLDAAPFPFNAPDAYAIVVNATPFTVPPP